MSNEKRLIDANVTFELLRSLGSGDYRRDKGTIMDAMKMISHPEYTPTVDAVEVIRCKDCKNYHPETGWCDEHSHFVDCYGEFCEPYVSREWKMFDEDYFCKDGKRKEDESNV